MQRWVEPDPIGIGGGDTNFYRVEGNNPTNEADPTGMTGIRVNFADGRMWSSTPPGDAENAANSTNLRVYVKPTFRLGIEVGKHAVVAVVGGKDGPVTLNGGGGYFSGTHSSNPHMGSDVRSDWSYFDVEIQEKDPAKLAAKLKEIYEKLHQVPYDSANFNSNTYAHQAIKLMGGKISGGLHNPDGSIDWEQSPSRLFKAWENNWIYGATSPGRPGDFRPDSYYDEWGKCTGSRFSLAGVP
jgi:uncharacterized protein RhaS with RHS repeats